uniref:Ig_4 domain-containing protein n=1 Tax=Heterorhabditis bacteriophora TaxID=37862 RepID=A0A1I7XKQ2_HETBA
METKHISYVLPLFNDWETKVVSTSMSLNKVDYLIYLDATMILLLLLFLAPLAAGLGRTQSVGIRGTLLCNDKPAAGVEIKMYDEDQRK